MTTETTTKTSTLHNILTLAAIAFGVAVSIAIFTPRMSTPESASAPDTRAADRATYTRATMEQTTMLAQALNEISVLMDHPTFTDEWKINVAVQLATIRYAHQHLLAIQAPADMQDVHSSLTNATSDCDASTDHIARGLDTLDVGEINEATRLIQSCTRGIQRTTDLLKAK